MLNHCFFLCQKLRKSDICVNLEPSSNTPTLWFILHSTFAAAASATASAAVGTALAAVGTAITPVAAAATATISVAATIAVCCCRYCCLSLVDFCLPLPLPLFLPGGCCMPPPLPLLIANVTTAATTAPVPSAATAATAAYLSAAGSATSLFPLLLPLFPSPLHHRFCFRSRCATTSVSDAIATVVSVMAAITDKKC
jgi:hypothetical protein